MSTEPLPFDLPLAREAFGTAAQLNGDATRRAGARLTAADLITPRLRRMDLWLFTRKAFSAGERSHPAILAALRAGDAERAARLVEASFREAGEALMAIVER